MATPYSPVDDYTDTASPHGGCSCFRRFCFGSDGHNYLLHEEETWVAATLKKVKQFSEVVAGPKWKNFIRKCGKLCHPKRSYDKQTAVAQFQYSPESYALNFAGAGGEQDEVLLHTFSTRFAPHEKAGL